MDFSETAFLVVLGLLLFGPKKLPQMGRQIGRFMAEFKRASAEFQNQLNDEVRQWENEIEETKRSILPPLGSTSREDPAAVASKAELIESPTATGSAMKNSEEHATKAENVASSGEASEPLTRAVTQGPNA